MADFGVYTKNADILNMVGANANATYTAVGETDKIVLGVESFINAETAYNWSDNFASLDADVKSVCTTCGASLCAFIIVQQDPNAWASSLAQTKADMLIYLHENALKTLKDKSRVQSFIKTESGI